MMCVRKFNHVPKPTSFLGLALVFAGMLANPALALKGDRQQPMDLNSQSWTGSLREGKQVFTGDVRISQGSLKIAADTGTVLYADGAVNQAILQGNPASVTQARDGGGVVNAQAKRIDYDLSSNKVILTGGVKIEENGNVTTGERFEYSLDSGAVVGNGGTGRVSMRLVPKPAKPPKPAE